MLKLLDIGHNYLILDTGVDSLSGTGSACTCTLADDIRLCELDCFFFAIGLSPGTPTDLVVGLYRTLCSKSPSANDQGQHNRIMPHY
jgi:hypothetical protein